jgi:hypothetical protein
MQELGNGDAPRAGELREPSADRGRTARTLGLALGLPLAGIGVLLAVAAYRWRARTAEMLARLRQGGDAPAAFAEAEFAALPPPVARYFRAVLRDGQPAVRYARFGQRGEFLMSPTPAGWRPFTATQHVATRPAGFIWDARIRVAPGLGVFVRDAFVEGAGSMFASVAGLWSVAAAEGTPEIAAGALHRFLAEAVWFPTALLPSHGVAWTQLDDTSARATLTAGATTVSLDFHFGEDGLVSRVYTAARARDVGGRAVPTPWQGRFSRYEERAGMRIPTAGEVEWLLAEGPQLYWRGEIAQVAFEFARPR